MIGRTPPRQMEVCVDGVVFESAKKCAEHFSISPSLVTYRLNSNKYKHWSRVNAQRPSND